MQQLTIRMPKEYLTQIDQIAKATGLKKSDITRMAIKNFIEAHGNEEDLNLYRKAKSLIGVLESGIPDLGQNHRKYLVQKIKALN